MRNSEYGTRNENWVRQPLTTPVTFDIMKVPLGERALRVAVSLDGATLRT